MIFSYYCYPNRNVHIHSYFWNKDSLTYESFYTLLLWHMGNNLWHRCEVNYLSLSILVQGAVSRTHYTWTWGKRAMCMCCSALMLSVATLRLQCWAFLRLSWIFPYLSRWVNRSLLSTHLVKMHRRCTLEMQWKATMLLFSHSSWSMENLMVCTMYEQNKTNILGLIAPGIRTPLSCTVLCSLWFLTLSRKVPDMACA